MQETQETQVPSLGREDPLEEGLATHPRILAWETPWTEEPGGLQSSILAWETPWTEEPGGLQSSILAWETPWTEEPGALGSIGSQRVRHD